MRSALAQKSITDLTRRRSRSFFVVLTLGLAVASIGIFAMPAVMDRSMAAEVEAGRLADLTVVTGPLELDASRLEQLRSLPNVRAVQTRSLYAGRVYVGERRAQAYVVGVPDFARQPVNVVHIVAGAAPGLR